MTIRAIVFDFDGLLMDTESVSLQAWTYEWAQWGLDIDTNGFFANHGGDITEERYAALARAVGDRYDWDLSHHRRLAYRDHLHSTLELSAGIGAWIDEADALGLRMAVASSSELAWLHRHLDRVGIRDRFEVLAGGDEVADHKPAPDVYLLALDRLGLDPVAAVAVEDSPHGVAAAQAAGLRCIAIPNLHTSVDRYGHADLLLTSAAAAPLADAIERACG